MIENKTIYGTGNSVDNARYDCVKKIAEYFCENCTQATIYQEYQDGYVIKINDNNIYFGIYSVVSGSSIYIAIASLRQTNESLSEDCESLSLLTDFTSIKALFAYKLTSTTITTSLYSTYALITLLSNEEDILLLNGQNFIAGVIQDENDINYIAIANVSKSLTFADAVFYNNDISYRNLLPLSSTSTLTRNNANEIFKVNMLNSAGYKFKKVYNILKSNNISAGSRYKINDDEYYALSTVILFRLEGSE